MNDKGKSVDPFLLAGWIDNSGIHVLGADNLQQIIVADLIAFFSNVCNNQCLKYGGRQRPAQEFWV